MATFHAIEGPLLGQAFIVPDKQRVIIGRYEIYDLIVPDASISRKHFAVEKRSDGFYLVDLGSLNGTQLNGHRISTAKLEQGDRVSAGQSVLCFDETDGAKPPVPIAEAADDEIMPVSDDDIIVEAEPAEAGPSAAAQATAPMKTATPPAAKATVPVEAEPAAALAEEADEKAEKNGTSRARARGTAKTERAVKKRTSRRRAVSEENKPSEHATKEAGGKEPTAGRCAACGREVTKEQLDGGEGAKTRLGFLCARCVEKRQRSGEKGSLEKFISSRRRQRR